MTNPITIVTYSNDFIIVDKSPDGAARLVVANENGSCAFAFMTPSDVRELKRVFEERYTP